MEQGIKSGADILMIGAKPLQVQLAKMDQQET